MSDKPKFENVELLVFTEEIISRLFDENGNWRHVIPTQFITLEEARKRWPPVHKVNKEE